MVSGVMHVTVLSVLTTLSGYPVVRDIYRRLYNYSETLKWLVLRSHKAAKRDIIPRKRVVSNTEAKSFKALASELLSLHPIMSMLLFRAVIRANACVPECVASLALCDMLDLLIVANTVGHAHLTNCTILLWTCCRSA